MWECMSQLLPQEPDPEHTDQDPAVVGLDENESHAVFSVLSSDTAREILVALYDSPATQSELADRVDTSIQNVDYHVENLLAADLVSVVDEWYSEKGNEMDVFAPSSGPLVVVGGSADQTDATRAVVDQFDHGTAPASPSD